uniref:Protein phosphatase 1K, mitochondrial n=1 Tax=Homo sapiens TaxID=9606 RepID=UPI00024DB0EA|nr:Chain A, Protein phosphatase 1K, mitochondrial [Homo sapiens]
GHHHHHHGSDSEVNQEAKPEVKPEVKPETHINLKVSDGSSEIFFKIKKTTPLRRLMEAFAKRQGKEMDSLRFLYDGIRIQADQAPEDLDMEDNDIIEAHREQIGGENLYFQAGKPIPKISLENVGCASQIGKRKENEDRFDFAQLTDEVLYFAVYDGHGGPAAADFCHTHMEKCIMDLLPKEKNLETLLTLAFLEIDKAFSSHARLSADATLLTSGTTATVALLRDGIELVVASVGDSRAILCRKGKPMKLTIDHTPERKDEKERIKKCGGFVAWNSLGQPHVNGRLAMTRSIGDLDLKTSGVIAEPETKRIKLHHADDSFLVLTTDGINFMVNSQEICDFVNQCHDPNEAAHAVTEQAIQYGTEDNSTAVVVPFGAWGKYKNSEINFS